MFFFWWGGGGQITINTHSIYAYIFCKRKNILVGRRATIHFTGFWKYIIIILSLVPEMENLVLNKDEKKRQVKVSFFFYIYQKIGTIFFRFDTDSNTPKSSDFSDSRLSVLIQISV